MKISHYFELEQHITGGMAASVRHQRKALEKQGIEYTTAPVVSGDVDVLHLNVMGPRSVYYAKKARRHEVPVVAHTHVTAEDFGQSFRFTNLLSRPLRPYLQWVYAHPDHLICPSPYNQDLINTYTDTESTVITNGVDTEKLDGFERFRDEYRERYDLSPPVVFLVGHVIKRKGLETFVETARKLPDLDFAWFGHLDPKLKGRSTRKLIDAAPDNCAFTGYVDDIRGAYAAGDIFYFPTKEENQGIALLEAMACGKPAVVRDIPVFDWLEHGTHCLKGGSEEGLREHLRTLQDDARRDELGANAQQLVEREHSLAVVGEELQDVYEALL